MCQRQIIEKNLPYFTGGRMQMLFNFSLPLVYGNILCVCVYKHIRTHVYNIALKYPIFYYLALDIIISPVKFIMM